MSVLPPALRLLTGAPWGVYALVVVACLVGYICRTICMYKIGSKALDKAAPDGVPEIVNAVTGYPTQRKGGRRRTVGLRPPRVR